MSPTNALRIGIAIAAIALTAVTLAPTPSDAETADAACPGPAFAWGGDGRCWGRQDGEEFAGWLNAHGTSAKAFEENWPHLADVFAEPWPPPPPLWKTCKSGYACAVSVIGHVFGGDISYELSIVGCETGHTWDAHAYGDAGERGWWQIHPTHFGWLDESRLYEPLYNTVAAYRLSEGGRDFSPWTCA